MAQIIHRRIREKRHTNTFGRKIDSRMVPLKEYKTAKSIPLLPTLSHNPSNARYLGRRDLFPLRKSPSVGLATVG